MVLVRTAIVALVGNPNTGKTTLFNALAGMRQRVGNYPGVTVEIKKGRMSLGEGVVELVDLPGTYSLAPRSPDDLLAAQLGVAVIPIQANRGKGVDRLKEVLRGDLRPPTRTVVFPEAFDQEV